LMRLDGDLKEMKKEIPVLDERTLNQAVSKIYELEHSDLLQARKFKIFVSPESREYIEKCFFCDLKDIESNFVKN